MFSFHFDQMSILSGRLLGVHFVHGERFGRAGSAQRFSVCPPTTTSSSSSSATRVVLVHKHGVPLAYREGLLLPVGLAEYLEVGEHHDRARDEERDGARDDSVRLVHYEQAAVRIVGHVLFVLVRGVPT